MGVASSSYDDKDGTAYDFKSAGNSRDSVLRCLQMLTIILVQFAERPELVATEFQRHLLECTGLGNEVATPSDELMFAEVVFEEGTRVLVGRIRDSDLWIEYQGTPSYFEWAVLRALLRLGGTSEHSAPDDACVSWDIYQREHRPRRWWQLFRR